MSLYIIGLAYAPVLIGSYAVLIGDIRTVMEQDYHRPSFQRNLIPFTGPLEEEAGQLAVAIEIFANARELLQNDVVASTLIICGFQSAEVGF